MLDLPSGMWKAGFMESTGDSGKGQGSPGSVDTWGSSILKAALILILAWAGFLFVPNQLLGFLSRRVTPHARDLLVTLWVVVFFVALSVVFTALQKGRRR